MNVQFSHNIIICIHWIFTPVTFIENQVTADLSHIHFGILSDFSNVVIWMLTILLRFPILPNYLELLQVWRSHWVQLSLLLLLFNTFVLWLKILIGLIGYTCQYNRPQELVYCLPCCMKPVGVGCERLSVGCILF